RRWRHLRLPEAVHLLHEEEDREGDDDEVDDRLDERAVGQHRCVRLPRVGEGRELLPGKVHEEPAEVDAAEQQADDGHQHVGHERVHDLPERPADDHADRQVEHAPAHGELAKLFQHWVLLSGGRAAEPPRAIWGGAGFPARLITDSFDPARKGARWLRGTHRTGAKIFRAASWEAAAFAGSRSPPARSSPSRSSSGRFCRGRSARSSSRERARRSRDGSRSATWTSGWRAARSRCTTSASRPTALRPTTLRRSPCDASTWTSPGSSSGTARFASRTSSSTIRRSGPIA